MPKPVSVLLLSSNGAGMGHLTRLLAYARHLPEGVRPHVVSLSQAVPIVESLGYSWEYLPSQGSSGLRPATWRALFAERMTELLRRVDPDVLVFDGTHPYSGLDLALARHPRTRAIWSRRAMWKPGRNGAQLAKSAWFESVIEPTDLASAADRGETTSAPAVRVGPVTLISREDLTEPAAARQALGLPPQGKLALVSLGAGNINDTQDEVRAAVEALHAHGIGVCVTAPAIAERTFTHGEVHLVRHFPLSRHLRAFDYQVAAAGYNSFHEGLRLGLPTLFIPNDATSLDDQVSRAEYAAAQGWALAAPTLGGGRARALISELVERADEFVAAAQAADPGNGAVAAAAEIMRVAQR